MEFESLQSTNLETEITDNGLEDPESSKPPLIEVIYSYYCLTSSLQMSDIRINPF